MSKAVCISVLMPAYNAECFIQQSVQSVLGQMWQDFELLVVDDCSTDETMNILSSFQDERLRVLRNSRNLGIVASLNHAMAHAKGRYIARIDADDYCLPTRFDKQKSYLDAHPNIVMVGSQMSVLDNGLTRRSRLPADLDPMMLQWQFYTCNPVGHSSMMFRASAVQSLGQYLRPTFQFAEDFDFSHRMLRMGNIAVLPEFLVIYRHHNSSLSNTRRAEMMSATAAVLNDAYNALLGDDCKVEARLAAEYFVAGIPVRSPAVLAQLGRLLNRLVDAFIMRHGLAGAQTAGVISHAGRLWWTVIQTSMRAGTIIPAISGHHHFRWNNVGRPGMRRLARSAVSGVAATSLKPLQQLIPVLTQPALIKTECDIVLSGVRLLAQPIRHNDPPVLYVEVDTEAEFDWQKPFDRNHTAVTSSGSQWRAQTIFDGYGLRPVYVVDYAVASQAAGYEPLRELLDRHACVIGAHLHPWINPPFEETVSSHNSFAGNLPPELEERKLRALVEVIEKNFRVRPLFYKAGRYGIGPHTMQTLARIGLLVDFSIMPKTDMTAHGGVDFRAAQPRPYRTDLDGVLSIPMTRERYGLVASLSSRPLSRLQSPLMTALHVPGMLSRLGLANTITLTPEGVTSEEQVRLIQAMVRRGYRTFVMHYHSPSLVAGNTQYVRSDAELAIFLRRIEDVCRFFFTDLGGMPGNPLDLLPQHMRQSAWPRPTEHVDEAGSQLEPDTATATSRMAQDPPSTIPLPVLN